MIEQEAQFTVLYDYVFDKLATSGLTKDELKELKRHPLGHKSLGSFVDANLRVGNFEWINDHLVNVDRQVRLDLTQKEDERLRLLAHEAGLTELELISKIVSSVLK